MLSFRRSKIVSVGLAVLYALVIAGYPLVSNISVYLDVHSRMIGGILRATVLVLSIFLIAFHAAGSKRIYRGILWIPLGVFWLLYIGRIAADLSTSAIDLSRPGIEYLAYAVGGGLVPMIALMVCVEKATIVRALTYTYLSALTAVILVVTSTLVLGLDETYWPVTGRLGTNTLNPILLGHLAATLVALTWFTSSGDVCRTRSQRVANALVSLGALVVLVLAASRGPMLALALTAVFYALSRVRHRDSTMTYITSAFFVFAITVVAVLYLALFSDFLANVDFPMREEVSVEIRLQLLGEAWRQFLNAPLFGGGLEVPLTGTYPHNVVMESFMATGIVGGMAFTVLLLTAALYAAYLIGYRNSYSWVGILYIQYLIGSLVSGSIYSSSVMWSMMGAVIGIYHCVKHAARCGYRNSGYERRLRASGAD